MKPNSSPRTDEPVREQQRPWVLVRADGSAKTGSGHIMRCLSLAAAFIEHGHDVVFASKDCSPDLRRIIQMRGCESILLEPTGAPKSRDWLEDAAETTSYVQRQLNRPSWIIVDHYELDAAWETAVSICEVPLLVIDDLANRPHLCDVLVDQNLIKDNHDRYPKLVPDGTLLLLGGEYALLRPEFSQTFSRRQALLLRDRAQDIVVFMGALDEPNFTLHLATSLLAHVEASKIVVVVGHLNKQRNAIRAWCHTEGVKCRLDPDNFETVLETCGVLVGACGMTAVEAQALDIPSILIGLTPIQRAVASCFKAQGRATLLDSHQCHDALAVGNALAEVRSLNLNTSNERPVSLLGAAKVVNTLLEIAHE